MKIKCPLKARVTAEYLKYQMEEIVRKNPTQAVGKSCLRNCVKASEE